MSWRVAVGGRFDLWIDGFGADRKIEVIKIIRELTGYGLAEAKAFSESLPKVMSGAVPVEEAVRLGQRFIASNGRTRITPSSEIPSRGLLQQAVVLGWGFGGDLFSDHDPPTGEDIRRALAELRSILHRDPEFRHLMGRVPNRLPHDVEHFTVTLLSGLPPGEADEKARELGRRLLRGDELVGSEANPPFWGAISVYATWC